MLKSFKTIQRFIGQKTEANILAAFAGESKARNKYDFFAKVAREEGYGYIADIFEETAINEHEHARLLFSLVEGIGSTSENLKAAMEGEKYEQESMYPTMAKEAKEEGEMEAFALFTLLQGIEKGHEERYQKLIDLVESGKVYERIEKIDWKCSVCGFVHKANKLPDTFVCPTCKNDRSHFTPEDINLEI